MNCDATDGETEDALEGTMETIDAKIVKLEPMRVASVYAFGTSPEAEAWNKLAEWAKREGLWEKRSEHPIFGFTNPITPNAHANYGYELWMQVPPELEPSGDTRIHEFMGGTYAVVRCDTHGDPAAAIPQTWGKFADWLKATHHKQAPRQELEQFVTDADDPDNLVLDLYLPIAE
jgi:DNA gyrase inhibitor GyrI